MSDLSKTLKDLLQVFAGLDKHKTSAYDTTATVLRVDGDTAWVHLPGGVDETPVQLTINAQKGDQVQVRVGGGRAWLTGNASAPPTDDTAATRANNKAAEAGDLAISAVENSNAAKTAAEQAEKAAHEAEDNARKAKKTTDEIEAYADTAGKTVTQILEDGETAGAAAREARTAADTALTNLAQVQSVLEVVEWIATHGTYVKATTFSPNATYYTITATQIASPSDDDKDSQGVLIYYEKSNGIYTRTADTEVDPLKTYYTVVGTPVAQSRAEDINLYYTLAVTEAMADYIQSHLVLTDEGLWLIKDGSGYKLKLTNYGSYIVAPDGTIVVNQNTADGNIVRALDGTVIAHLGYGEGIAERGSTDVAPFYTFGIRSNGDVVGNLSLAEGSGCIASAWVSHAEGYFTKASGNAAHAEGAGAQVSISEDYTIVASGEGSHAEGFAKNTYGKITASGVGAHAEGYAGYQGVTASGVGAHAEGEGTRAIGDSAHAEGFSTYAEGAHSHAQNNQTQAVFADQTVIGRHNDNQQNNAFEIGNGTSGTNRSNAFTVDWDGNVEASGDVNSNNALLKLDVGATAGTDKELHDALVSLGWEDVIIGG